MNLTVDAILMASGFSKRFGDENKLTKKFNGIPLAQYTLQLVCDSRLYQNIYFITAEPEVAALCNGYSVHLLQNTNPKRGQCESIRLGSQASKADFLHFFTCDQPLLTQNVLQTILAHKQAKMITQPIYQNHPASPILFSNYFKPELMELKDGESGKNIKNRYPNSIISVEFDTPYILEDIDTQGNFKKLESVNLHKKNTEKI